MDKAGDGERPLRAVFDRWSRRKHQTRRAEATPPAAAAPAAPPSPPSLPPVLPDLATLTAASDYTVFLGADVPEAIRTQALRILWRSDPVLANRNGLNDYDDDYTAIGTIAAAVRTAFDAVRGYGAAGADAGQAAETAMAAQADAPSPHIAEPAATTPPVTTPDVTTPPVTTPAAVDRSCATGEQELVPRGNN